MQAPCVSEVIHLEQCHNEDFYKFNANKCVEDFNRQCNMFLPTLNMQIHMLEMLFSINIVQRFMVSNTSTFNNCMNDVYNAWRIAMS